MGKGIHAEGGRELVIVVCERPRCPQCGSVRIRTRRTIRQGDDSTLRYVRCMKCSKSFKVVLE